MAFISKKSLSRRTFLKGAGVTLALPLLESMVPAATPLTQTAAAARRTRFGAMYIPHGATMEKWTPEKAGTDFAFSEILAPLEPYRSYVNIISDLSHPQAYGGGSATSNHNRSAAAFLSGAHGKEGAQAYLGITMDQVAAKKIGQDTPLPSVEMAIEGASLACDGLSCAYRNTISWGGPTSPLPMANSPQVIFERLFGDGANDAERRGRRAQSVSLLDSVLTEAGALQKTLPAADKSRMDQYLTDVREIERRIQKAGEQLSPDLELPTPPVGVPGNFEDHIKMLFDLQVLAWQADITRVTTLLMAKELSGATYPNSTVRDAFHTLSHHSNQKANKDRFAVLNRYHVTVLTYLIEKLKRTPDGDGNLLDHSVFLYGSAISDGNEHNHAPLPIVLIGNASGKLKGGRHLRNPKDTTMSNLLLSLLDVLGAPMDKFGDSTGKLEI
jgi:hypothetical protein